MALQFQPVAVNLFGRLNTKAEDKTVLPGELLDLRDGIYKAGAVEKRNGYDALGKSVVGGSDLSSADALARYKDELLLFDAGNLYSYAPGIDAWVDKGSVSDLVVDSTSIVRNSAQQTKPDFALTSGVALYAWRDTRDSNSIRASVIDHDSGVPFIADFRVSGTGDLPRCLAFDGFLFVLWVDSGDLKARRVDPTSPTGFDAAVTLRTDVNTSNPSIDAVPRGNLGVVAYHDSGGEITLFYLTSDPAVGTALNGQANPVSVAAGADNCLTVALTDDEETIVVAGHDNSNGLRAFGRKPDFTEQFAAVTLSLSAIDNVTLVDEGSGTMRAFFEVTAGNTYDYLVQHRTVDTAGTTGSTATLKRSVGLAHKAFRHNNATWVGLRHDSTLQATYFLVNADGLIAGKAHPGTAAGVVTGLSSVVESETGVFDWASGVKTRLVSELNEDDENVTYTREGLSRTTWDFTASNRYHAVESADGLHIAGGVVGYYDGAAVVENGFHIYPENVTVTAQTSGGSMADGTYGVAVIFQWVDNQGRVHRSAPYLESGVTISGSSGAGSIDFTIPTLRLTDKSNVTVEVYRTEVDATDVYYKVTSTTSPTSNDPDSDTVSFTATAADSAIVGNEALYTVGGILENIAPPAASILASVRGRVFVASPGEDRVYYSKRPGIEEGLGFSDLLYVTVDPEGGNMTALAALDDKLIIFKRNNIYALMGGGPNNAGRQNTFSQVQLITTDVGCVDQRSVALFDGGLVFKSAKGIYQLDRGLRVQYVGDMVEAYNDATITSAVLVEDANQVRFTTEDDRALVYDYYFGKWSTWRNHEAVDAARFDGAYHYLRSDGTVRKENPGSYVDEATPVHLGLTTAWIKAGGIQGYQRVRMAHLIGEFLGQHRLRLRVGYDYQKYYWEDRQIDPSILDSSVWGDDSTWGDSDVWGGVTDDVYQYRAHLGRQKCQAVKFDIEEITGSSQGARLTELRLEVGLLRGSMRLGRAKTLS